MHTVALDYGKPFYYLLGNLDILLIYKISYKVDRISNEIYKISNKRYKISDIIIRYLISFSNVDI